MKNLSKFKMGKKIKKKIKNSFLKKYLGIERIAHTLTYNFAENHFNQHKKQLVKELQTFLTITTKNKKSIFHGDTEYIYFTGKEKMKMAQLGLRMQLKKIARNCIKEYDINTPKINAEDINYYHIGERILSLKQGQTIPAVNCFDINKAYYKAAYNLRYIDESFYHKCIELPKQDRLTLIGSLGSQKYWHFFSDGKEKETWITQDQELRSAWFHICNEVDKTMYDLIKKLGTDFLFYWVDSMYFTDNRHNEMVIDYFKKQGFDVKNETVKNLKREQVFLKSLNKFRESDSVTIEKFNFSSQEWEKKEFTIFKKPETHTISDTYIQRAI